MQFDRLCAKIPRFVKERPGRVTLQEIKLVARRIVLEKVVESGGDAAVDAFDESASVSVQIQAAGHAACAVSKGATLDPLGRSTPKDADDWRGASVRPSHQKPPWLRACCRRALDSQGSCRAKGDPHTSQGSK